MQHADYLAHDATALAARVAAGDVTPHELLDLALAQHARVHGRVNAVVRLMEREARDQAAGPLRGPLAGVPFLIKDGVQDYAGIPTTYGSRALTRNVPAAHAHVVRRYLEAGLVVFGKTNLPEFATRAVTDPELFGRTNNPWDLGRTPGGSSGGAAAAVAAGIVPMAAGNDGGGSLRIPAACCGLFALRPSRGRVSSGPGIGEVWFGASSEGVISRSVRDSALALDVLHGAEPGDPFVIAPPAAPYVELMRRDPGRLRIGYATASPIAHGTGDPSQAEQRLLGFLHGTGILGVLARLGLLDRTVDRIATDNLRYVPFTQLSNLTGTPSMSVPLHWTADGLPLGVQFTGPFGSEDRLLQLARQLEDVQPWFGRMAEMAHA
ncbi:MAG: amidase [Massilia sp.]|nr:amidase [Massilia sp.]